MMSWILQHSIFKREQGVSKTWSVPVFRRNGGAALTDLCPKEGDGPVIENSFVGRQLTEQVQPDACSNETDPIFIIIYLVDKI
jgi:hypothetical protein